jgi:hypothetical protein
MLGRSRFSGLGPSRRRCRTRPTSLVYRVAVSPCRTMINIRCVGQRWFKTGLRQSRLTHGVLGSMHNLIKQRPKQARSSNATPNLFRYGQYRSSHRKLRHDQPDKLDCGCRGPPRPRLQQYSRKCFRLAIKAIDVRPLGH